MISRYTRQIALSDVGLTGQEKFASAHICMVGAGGLGATALPALAGAGIGQITIIDHDTIDITNLHRQTIYRTDQTGQRKAECAAEYLRALNPEITVTAITEKLTADNATAISAQLNTVTLILDGSDNFETKSLLNDIAITMQTPLITASVNQWGGQIGIFKGHEHNKPCYRCIFPEFPTDAKNCNEAGILGTSAGLVGMMQAHTALLHILNHEILINFNAINLKTMRNEFIKSPKTPNCPHCNHTQINKQKQKENTMPDMISIDQLNDADTIIIDVRNPDELEADPLTNEQIKTPPINIPLPEFIARINELPEGKRLAFLCAGNIRSRQAAEYLSTKGYKNVCVLDKFSL
ncbi:MAG: ThiF family adenylyltransferase [Alphaproteobacteria bacterium]